jgi:DNA mismatch repair protein MutL
MSGSPGDPGTTAADASGKDVRADSTREDSKEGAYEQQTLPGFLDIAAKPNRRIIGCAFRTYWIVEYGDRLFMIDQHAAHEKVLYTRFMREYESSSVSSQQLDPPIVVTLGMDEQALYEEYRDAFRRAGFEIESFGGREYKISAVPHHMSSLGSKSLFTEMLDHLDVSSDPKKLEIYVHRVATEACKAAVKGGDVLSVREAEALIDELLTCEDPYHCPHGRPTIISFTEKDLEKRFKRII